MKLIGMSEFRKMNASYLRQLAEPLEVCLSNQPLRVLIPYRQYLEMQDIYLNAKLMVGAERCQGESR